MADKIQFNGFEPTFQLKRALKDMLLRVEHLGPSRSTRTAEISKSHKGYLGKIKVNSSAGIFEVQLNSSNPDELLDNLRIQICNRFDIWKKSRLEEVNYT